MPKSYNQSCNIANTLDIIGDRWTLLIIRDIFNGKRRFSELKQSLPGIAPTVLSERIQNLESDGIIESALYSTHPPRYEYRLTAKGRDLRDVLNAISIWGNKHLPHKYTELVHTECGHEVSMTYYCPHCREEATQITYRDIQTDCAES